MTRMTGADKALADNRRFLPFADDELGRAYLDRATHRVYFEGSDEFNVISKFTVLDRALGGLKGTIGDLKRRATRGEDVMAAAEAEIRRFEILLYGKAAVEERDARLEKLKAKLDKFPVKDLGEIYKKFERDEEPDPEQGPLYGKYKRKHKK